MNTQYDLDERLRATVGALVAAGHRRDPSRPVREGAPLTGVRLLELFDAQIVSRQLDLAGRWLRSFGEGFYTVGSAGHEGNAAVAAALAPTDPALLHYRSGAFYCVRAAQVHDERNPEERDHAAATAPAGAVAGTGALADGARSLAPGYAGAARDVLRGMVASAREPIAGGRDKVFGRADLAVVPTTSTIASHLPRAVGLGLALERARRLDGADQHTAPDSVPWPPAAVVLCSFGDASVNHASATAALNTAGWYDHTGLRLPVLFLCEDNGPGAGVRSPQGWVGAVLRAKPGVRYFTADGTDLVETYAVAAEAVRWVRRHRRPAVLHLSTVRLMGYAGADAQSAYRTGDEITEDLKRDPLLVTARLLTGAGVATGAALLTRYDEIGWQVRRIAEEVLAEPKLADPAEVLAPLAPRRPGRVARAVAAAAARAEGTGAAARAAAFGGEVPELAGPLTLAQSINAALADGLLDHPRMAVFGEDVGARAGCTG